MASKEQIKTLLGSGLSNEIVASAVGCSPSYISQLLAEETFASDVATLKIKTLTADSARDQSIGALEDKLLSKLHTIVDDAHMYKPQDILRAFALVNAAKRRGAAAQQSHVVNSVIVNLQLPTKIVNKFTPNSSNEVVDVIDGNTGETQSMVSMPGSSLVQKLSREATEDGQREKYEKLQRFIAAPSANSG